MLKTKRLGCIAAALLLVAGLYGNGLNLNSLGSKALSMGGAFIGLADDFSTIYWNPAGAAAFSSAYFGFYLTDVIPTGTYRFDALGIDTSFTKHYISGLVAFYYPAAEGLVLGVGVYVPSGLGTEWKGEDLAVLTGGNKIEWMSKVGVVSISPLIAYRISEKLYVGATFNINYGMMDLKTTAGMQQYSESSTGWGVGATLGMLYKASDKFSIGVTARSASKISFSGSATMEALKAYAQLGVPVESDFERDITWPIWIGVGVAYRPSDYLTITADVQWTQWSQEDVIITDYKSNFWKAIFEMTPEKEEEMVFHWKDATQIRFGVEYRASENIALRAGYYYDPAPAPNETMNILLPNFTNNVITAGVGIRTGNLNIDIGFEYLMGKEREVLPSQHNMPGHYGMNIIVPNISISYIF